MRVAAFATLALYTLVAAVLAAPIQAGSVEIAARSVENHLEARDYDPPHSGYPRPHHHHHHHHHHHQSHDVSGPVADTQTTSTSNIQATSKRSVETLERRNKFWDGVKKVGGAALKVAASIIFRREGGPLPPLERRSIVGQFTGLNKRDPIFTVHELE